MEEIEDNKPVKMYAHSCEEVLQTEFLLGEILKRTKGSKDYLRGSFVSSFWRATARLPAVLSGFVSRNSPCFIGFMCEHSRVHEPARALIAPPATPTDDSARAIRARFDLGSLYGKHVLGTYGGRVICRIEDGKRQGRMYTSMPYSLNPKAFASVGRPVPALSANPEDSTYGQFVVVPLTNGPENVFCAFFVKDPSGLFNQDYEAVKFNPPGRVQVHVCVFSNGGWVRHIFDSMALLSSSMFQRSPYCVQAGSRIYMMYLIGLIVCFDAEQGTFRVVDLPGQMRTMIKSCLQYTAGPHPRGDLMVVMWIMECLLGGCSLGKEIWQSGMRRQVLTWQLHLGI